MPMLRTMARTAVISGTATAVSNNVSRRQADKWQREAEPAPVAAAPAADDPIAKVKELAELHAQGILTDEEFAAAKAKLLA
ncbi:unannotated protein [freshwater metagenome]|uniref:Unannotated protein n=1 Tax=freshwater metagenome TaxID=449393 RepID=A0A6J7DEB1_9ZZZZ|nr:SHOCT domain-containing protein [Actinomycetota bacterium]